MAKHITAERAIRLKCLECSCGNKDEVMNCLIKNCPLYQFRMGDGNTATENEPTQPMIGEIMDKKGSKSVQPQVVSDDSSIEVNSEITIDVPVETSEIEIVDNEKIDDIKKPVKKERKPKKKKEEVVTEPKKEEVVAEPQNDDLSLIDLDELFDE